jgi:hypothetical protein
MADVGSFNVAIRPRKGPRHRWVGDLAAAQHGVVAHRQLVLGGISRSAIQRLIHAGWLRPVHVGVYAVGHRAVGYMGRWMAAVLGCGPEAVLSHQPAAALWSIRRTSSGTLHVTAPRPRKGPHGVRLHRVRELRPEDRTERDGIPVTSVPRTLLDLAEVLPFRQLVRALEQAVRLDLFDLRAIEALLERCRGRHGLKPLRAAIAEVTGEPPRINSDWERDFLDFCADHGIPRPELNVIVEGYEVDVLWREQKLIVELDSFAFHSSRRAFEADREKDADLQLAEHRVLHVTWLRFTNQPAKVAATIRTALTRLAAA